MRKVSTILATTLFGFALQCSPASAVGSADKTLLPVTIYKQKHGYLGNLEVISTPDAIRISEGTNGNVVFSKGPDWKVTVYNTNRKIYYDMTFADWKTHGLRAVWVMMSNTSEWPIVKIGPGTHNGRQADKYILPADPQARAKLKAKIPVNLAYGKAGEYWIDKENKGARERATVLFQLFKIPDAPNLPLELKVFFARDSGFFGNAQNIKQDTEKKILETIAIKQTNLPRNTFAVPAGYRRAKDDSEVTISKSSSNSLDDMVKDMGLGETFYKR
jgi:DNA-directed RNA polymerase subunit H (RpoH/RPB5)